MMHPCLGASFLSFDAHIFKPCSFPASAADGRAVLSGARQSNGPAAVDSWPSGY